MPSRSPPAALICALVDPQSELAEPLDEAPDLVGIKADPEHDVLEADDAPEHLLGLADAAVDGDPGWSAGPCRPRAGNSGQSRPRPRRSGCRPRRKSGGRPRDRRTGSPPSSRSYPCRTRERPAWGRRSSFGSRPRTRSGRSRGPVFPRAFRTAGCADPCWAR